jgi:non-heme chloroperoxidase
MFFLSRANFRCITHDRRGHGRSEQPSVGNNMDTYADDLADVVAHSELIGVVHIGHSAGGTEVARYVRRHGTGHVAGVVLVAPATPLLLKSDAAPDGVAIDVFDALREAVLTDRSQFFRTFADTF